MHRDVRQLRDLLVELERITVHIIKVEGESSDPQNYFFREITMNGKDPLLYQSYLIELWENVKSSHVVLSYSQAKRDQLKAILTSIKSNFSPYINQAFDPQYSTEVYCITRNDLVLEFSRDAEWLIHYNKAEDVIGSLAAMLSHQFRTILEITEKLILQTEVKVPIDRQNRYYSFHYQHWGRNADPIRDLHSILEKNDRIEKINWQYFSQSFSPETKRHVTHRIIWLGNVSEFKLLIDTLFETGKFTPSNKKWDVAERCFILKKRKDFEWSTMRLQKHPKLQPTYIDSIKLLFGK